MGFGNVKPSGAGVGPYVDPRTYDPRVTATNGNRQYGGGDTNRTATAGAVAFKSAMGLPSFQDLFSKVGGPGGIAGGGTVGGLYDDKVFGHAAAASAGAAKAASEMAGWKAAALKGKASLLALKGQIADPTQTAGFKNVMRLNSERLGQASEASRQAAADAASRRGYVGGYNPAATERARLEAIAMAGYEGVGQERKSLQDQYAAEGNVYGSDLGAYSAAMGAYKDLLSTYASIPTKSQSSNLQSNPMLDLYSKLLGGLGGSYGDIFGTASHNVQYDTQNTLNAQNRERAQRDEANSRIRAHAAAVNANVGAPAQKRTRAIGAGFGF